MKSVSLLLGSNVGERATSLAKACTGVETLVGKIHKRSSLYETEAWGKTDQPPFLNQAIEVPTTHPPIQLLGILRSIEVALGRTPGEKWGPRIIDIDVLLYSNEIHSTPDLIIPHPRLHERRFALTPLAEINPELIHPILGRTVQQLLDECGDGLRVVKLVR